MVEVSSLLTSQTRNRLAGSNPALTECIRTDTALVVIYNMKRFVYILQLVNGQYYVGSTNDMERRFVDHKT